MLVPDRSSERPTYPEYAELRQEADRRSRFVDRADLDRMEDAARRRDTEWCSTIIGYVFPGIRSISTRDANLLVVADERNITPPLPAHLAEAFAEAKRRHEEQEAAWKAKADAAAKVQAERAARWVELQELLPVPVEVRHNYTSSRHLENYTQGADHIYLPEGLTIGRLNRPAHDVLCSTPSRRKDLAEFPHTATDGRLPTCKACWNTAERITSRRDH